MYLFRQFTVYDQKSRYQHLEKLQDMLFDMIDDKPNMLGEIINEFLLSPNNETVIYN
jgi:hypothetical protein